MLAILLTAAQAVQATPLGNPGDWIRSQDYPSSETSKAVTGVTAFALMVGRDGSVQDCRIVSSSGSVVLDATTCALIKARARFSPARDGKGKKIEGFYRSRVKWQLPANTAVSLPQGTQVIAIAIDVDPKGIVERCETIEGVKDLKDGQPTPCVGYPVGFRVRAATGPDGKGLAYRIVMRQSMEFKPR